MTNGPEPGKENAMGYIAKRQKQKKVTAED
jgi:hypothetical protein